MEYDEDNSERCEHGLLWEFECEMCEKESNEFFTDLFAMFGDGDVELGKKRVLEALKKPRDSRTRASESK